VRLSLSPPLPAGRRRCRRGADSLLTSVPPSPDPESLQLTVTSRSHLPAAEFLKNFEKAADALMDLHEKEKAKTEGGKESKL
jgi:hypothetical protein